MIKYCHALNKRLWVRLWAALLIGLGGVFSLAWAEDIATWTAEHCSGCHQLNAPEDKANFHTLEERMTRLAPPLYYAGDKYQLPWLTAWLQDPELLYPAGVYPPAQIQEVDAQDTVRTLEAHRALEPDQAAAVAEYLIGLHTFESLIAAESYTPGKVPKMLGEANFHKFKGCGSCHRDAPDYGGLSGPELYTASERLRPEYIRAYLRNPQAWEPRSLMPNPHLNDTEIDKLIHYMHALSKD